MVLIYQQSAYQRKGAKLHATNEEREEKVSLEEDEDILSPHLLYQKDDSKSIPDDSSHRDPELEGGDFLLAWDLVIPLLTWLLLLALLEDEVK